MTIRDEPISRGIQAMKRLISGVLCVLLALSLGTQTFAADAAGTPYPAYVGVLDKVFGAVHDAAFGLLQKVTRAKDIPTYGEYLAADKPYLFAGTDGETVGSGWSAAFASGSVIPEKWRRDAHGKADPNGYCLNAPHTTGGYPYVLTKIGTEQMLRLFLLSNHTDANRNGIDDFLLFISVDGVGISAGMCKTIRLAVVDALAEKGVAAEDILGINISATHCHMALDTQGMNFLSALPNSIGTGSSLHRDMQRSMTRRAAACAVEAFEKTENGNLFFFESDPVGGAGDKLDSGQLTKNTFSCFLFEGVSGEKTILANLGAHPVSSYALSGSLFADYPYFTAQTMRDAGYNFLFVQSAQAAIRGPSPLVQEGSARDKQADAYVRAHALTKEDWAERYGRTYAELYYANPGREALSEKSMEEKMKNGYLFAHHILDAATDAVEVEPLLQVRSTQTLIRLENGVMAFACISGLLGENTVEVPDAQTRCGVMVELNYLAIGRDVVILTAPGELAPSLLLGSDPDYQGSALWTGVTSWTGEEWPYDTLQDMVRKATGDPDKTLLLFGITNDALGYVYPDVCATRSILAARLFYKETKGNRKAMANCMLLTMGTHAASQMMDGYLRLIGNG